MILLCQPWVLPEFFASLRFALCERFTFCFPLSTGVRQSRPVKLCIKSSNTCIFLVSLPGPLRSLFSNARSATRRDTYTETNSQFILCIFLSVSLFICLPTYLPIYLSIIYLYTYLPAYLLSYLPTYLPICLPTYLPT